MALLIYIDSSTAILGPKTIEDHRGLPGAEDRSESREWF